MTLKRRLRFCQKPLSSKLLGRYIFQSEFKYQIGNFPERLSDIQQSAQLLSLSKAEEYLTDWVQGSHYKLLPPRVKSHRRYSKLLWIEL